MPNTFGLIIDSHDVTPANGMGATVTPGNNAYGSYVQVLDGSTQWPAGSGDAYGILININSNNVVTTARDTLVTIGIDPAGGTSYTDTINHLLGSCAALYIATTQMGGSWYYFPLHIRNGSSIGAKASVNNASVATLRVFCQLECQPSRPELVKAGTFVRTFGDVTASSAGTGVAVAAAEGAWVQLGSAVAEPLWFWDVAIGQNSGTMTNAGIVADLGIGDATNKKIPIVNAFHATTSSEILSKVNTGRYALAAVGDLVYARARSSGALSGVGAIAYGVGG